MIHLSDADNFKLLKTGQTTQYGGYLDDGFYEMGAAKEYTIHTLLQYAGTTNIVLNAKTDVHSNNCVYDKRTKLMWSRYVAASVGPAADGKLPWTTNVNGEGIFTYCAAANVANLGGYSDWRIPNVFELTSLQDHEAPTCAPDSVAFPGWPTSSYVLSSTTCSPNTALVSIVNFNYPTITPDTKTGEYFVALVRGG